MLQEAPYQGKIQVIARHDNGKPDAEAVTYYLQGNVVYVRLMAGQKNDRMLFLGGFLGH